MTTKARFLKAADNTRPFKSHRYDVFGLKINRPLTLFGRAQLNGWISLENNPTVESYCERPILVPDTKPKRVVDFWVRHGRKEYLWILQRPGEIDTESSPQVVMPAFCTWAVSQQMNVQFINPSNFDNQTIFLDNWGRMIRDLAANKRFVSTTLINQVRESIQNAKSISSLESVFPNEDPVLIKTAAFALIHSGQVCCLDLDNTPLGPQSMLVVV